MTRVWLVVLLVGLATILIKSGGVLLAGKRSISLGGRAALARLAPALFGALLATQTFARDGALTLDARAGGLAAAALGAYLRLPPLLVLGVAVVVTAALRRLG
ncbi:MAG: AzlD domain-containing protein [Gemmatimonadaceae bacterium]